MERSETIGQLAAALSKAQATFRAVPKGKTARIKTKSGGEYSYKYADLADVWDTCRSALADNKLSVIQMPEDAGDDRIGVVTMLCHESGEWVSGFLGMRISDASRTGEMSPQALGMAVTYLRRYGFASILGLVTDDDTDGHGGEQKEQKKQEERQPQRPAAKPAQNDEQLAAIIARITELVAEGAGLKVKLPAAPKALNQMSYTELIAHGKALKAAIDRAQTEAEMPV